MKIIKRNGAEVPFDITKIITAVTKASDSVGGQSRLTKDQITQIAAAVTDQCQALNRAVSVEEVQDMVENQLMDIKAHDVARHYITYRYVQSLKRQTNTTDERILSLIECQNEEVKQENANKNPTVNSVQRDYMAGEISKDLTARLLLDPEIVKAHQEGLIHFHDSDYFAQHMHNCDLVNLEDMLQNGTVISGTYIEKPHSFSTACNIATQIIAQVASNQYGGQSISLTHLAPFVDVSRKKIAAEVEVEMAGLDVSAERKKEIVERRLRSEINRGVQTIQYQVVTLMTTNGQAPFITVFMYLGEARNPQEKADLAIIIEETIRQRYQGVKNEAGVWITPAFPQADLCAGRGQHPPRHSLLLPDRAGRQVHRKTHGARLYLRKEDAGAQGGQKRRRPLLHLHGLPQLPDPLCGPRDRQAQVLRPVQSGRCHHQSGGRGALLQGQL